MTTPQQFQVGGMSCGHCANAVTQALRAADPQAQVHVDVATGQVEVHSTQPRQLLAAAIVGAGYVAQ